MKVSRQRFIHFQQTKCTALKYRVTTNLSEAKFRSELRCKVEGRGTRQTMLIFGGSDGVMIPW